MGILETLVVYPIAAFLALHGIWFLLTLLHAHRYRGLAAQYRKARAKALEKIAAHRQLLEARSENGDQAAKAELDALLSRHNWFWERYDTELIESWMPDELIAQYKDDTREMFLMAHLGLACIIYGCLFLIFASLGAFWLGAVFLVEGFIIAALLLDETPPTEHPIQVALSTVAITLTTVFGAGSLAFTSAPASYIAHHSEKTLYVTDSGGYGDTPARFKLEGKVAKKVYSSSDELKFSWSEQTPAGSKAFENYYPADKEKEVHIIDDLKTGEKPYVVHQQVFDVLDSYRDGKESMCEYSSWGIPPCFHRNAWKTRDRAYIHIPKGTYDEHVYTEDKGNRDDGVARVIEHVIKDTK